MTMLALLGRTALEGGLLALGVWIGLRAAQRLHLPPSWAAALWWLVGLRFLIGLAGLTAIEIPILPAVTSAPSETAPPMVARVALPPRSASQPEVLRPETDGRLAVDGESILLLLWLAGCALPLPRWARSSLAVRALLRASRPLADPERAEKAAAIAGRLGLARVPEVRIAPGLEVPQVVGLWRPRVLVPEALAADPEAFALAVAHEMAHVRRRDLPLGLVPALAARLFFFHPLARIAAREYAFAREVACDHLALEAVGAPPERYGRLLLRFGAVPSGLAFAAAQASPTFRTLKRRLLMLDHDPRTRRPGWPIAALVGAAALATIVPYRLTAQRGDHPADDPPSASSLSALGALRSHHAPPPAPPAPPTPPTAPAPPRHDRSARLADSGRSYILLHGDSAVMSGASSDLRKAKAQRQSGEDLLWFRDAGKQYVVRDARTLAAAHALFRDQIELGEKQGALGERQGELGAKQGALGAKQGEIGAQMGELGVRQAELDHDDEDAEREIERKMKELDRQMETLGEQMDALGEQQEVLGRQQDELGRQHEAAAAHAEEELEALIGRVLDQGLAEEVR